MRRNTGGRGHRPPQKTKAKSPGAFARKALAFAMAVILSVGNVLGMFAPAAAYASGGYGNYVKGYQINYDNFFTSRFTVDGNEAYCANPSKNAPASGSYPKVSPILKQPERAAELRADMWFSYGAPGFDASMWPSTWYDGSPMTPDRYRALSHIIIADTSSSDGSAAMYGCSQSFRQWVMRWVLGFVGSTPTYMDAVGRKMAARAGEVPPADQFDVFMLNAGSSLQYILSYTYNPNVLVNFTKVSADAKITSGNSEYAYAGATYDIYDASNNQKVATITTNDSGHADYKLKPSKSYYAIETKGPQGFKVNPNRIPFTTGNDTSSEQLVDDPGYVMLTVAKKDSATLGSAQPGATLEGAEFKCVSLSTPGWETTGTTNEDGVLRFNRVPFGKIVVTETKAPTGYKLDSTPHEYEVKSTGITDAGIIELVPEDDFKENVVAFDLTIAKTKGGEDDSWESDDGMADPAAGVEFEIVSNTTKEVVGTLTTNESGFASTEDAATVNPEAVSGDATYDPSKPWMGEGKRNENINGALPYDEAGYTVREVPETVPEGFDHVDDWRLSAEQMADGANLQFSVIDKTLNSKIQIVKTDAASGNTVPLAGFSFNILDAQGHKISMTEADIDTFTTDDSGWVTLPDRLPSGDYKVHEVAAQPPYLLNGEDVPFTVSDDYQDASAATVVKVSDKQAHGMATIHKACAEDGCPWCDGGGLSGAEFDVVAREDVTSPDGTVQAISGEVVDHVKTGGDGTAETKLLPLGDGTAEYAFVETKAPAGHQLDTTPIEFTLSWENDTTEVVYADANAKNAPTETIVDKTVMGTDTPLPGAEFDLWPDVLEGDYAPSDDAKGALALRLDGFFEHSEAVDGLSASLVQTFDYAEVSLDVPEGYKLSMTNEEGSEVVFRDGIAAAMPGSYELALTDTHGNAVDLGDASDLDVEAGKSYGLSYSEGILGWGAGMKVSASDMERASYDESDFRCPDGYDQSDIVVLDGIEPGTYKLSLKGYGSDASLELAVDAGACSYVTAHWNGGLSEESHMLAPFAQAVIDLMYDDFNIDLTTNEDGTISIKHLPARCADLGDMLEYTIRKHHPEPDNLLKEMPDADEEYTCQIAWRIQEVKAPDGFLVDDAIRTFTIHDDGTTEGEPVHTVPVEDDYTKVEISKRDITNEAEVEGAKLTITDAEGNVVASWTSTTEPHRIDALAPGDYTLTEEMTPNSYDKAQSIDFTVLPTGEIQTVTMYDEPINISGEIDKRQEIADPVAEDHEENGDLQNKADVTVSDEGFYDYSLDYRSTSSTWTDEFTVEDGLDAANDGVAELVGITTAQGWQDYDGLMNVWYTTDQTPADYVDDSGANATLSDGHENPWLTDESNEASLGDDGRAIDYTGWRLWKADVSTTEATELKVSDLGLADGERVTGIRFEYGRVEEGFTTRADDWDRENIKSGHDDLDDVQATHKGDGFSVPASNRVEIRDAEGNVLETRYMSDGELAAREDGAGYMIDYEGRTVFVLAEDVHHVEERHVPYAPAVIHMQVTDDYVEGTQLDNSAKVDLYRNGGGNGLEDHDDDFVTQVPKKIVSETPATPGKNLDQTGSDLLVAACACAAVAAAAGGAYAYRKRKAASGASDTEGTDPDSDPDGAPKAEAAEDDSGDTSGQQDEGNAADSADERELRADGDSSGEAADEGADGPSEA